MNEAGEAPQRGSLTTTTVRFDSDLWSELERHSRRLGIAKSAFIRDAVLHRVVAIAAHEHTARSMFGADLAALDRRVSRIETVIVGPCR